MRIIVPGDTFTACEKAVAIKKREGWKPVNDMKPKLDDSGPGWDIRYVVVMERPDSKEHKEKAKNRKWNRSSMGGPL